MAKPSYFGWSERGLLLRIFELNIVKTKSASMASPRKKRPLKHSSSMSQAKEAELQKAFSLADADGSGRITEEEFYQMYRNQGGHAPAQQLVGHFP